MEEIYVNVDYDKPVGPRPSTNQNQTGPRSSERRFHGAVVVSLGVLSVFLLAGLIGLGVTYHDFTRHSAAELSTIKANLQASNDKLSSISEERDLLNASLAEKTKELDRLQSLSKQKKTCPAGWGMIGCSCYFVSTESASWEKGRQYCRERGADLVIIDTLEEQEFVTKIIKQTAWIGLNDRESEGTWKWTDGTPLTQAYWWRGKPDNGGGDPQWGEEDCVQILTGEQTKENWNDRRCDDTMNWICEKVA